jgi:DNA-binding response OmpR family regulator
VLGRPREAEDRAIDIMITRLRKKLAGPDEGKRLFRSVRFVG